jgi:hypothetical protein
LLTTLETIVAKVPVLAVAGAILAGIFVLLIVGAIVSHWRDRRRKAAIRHEPDFDESARNDVEDLVPVYGPAPPPPPPAPPPPRRRGFGFAALTVAFVIGLLIGMAAMTTARHEIAAGLTRLAALIRTDPDQPAPGPEETAPPPRVATGIAPDPAADVGPRLAAFAASLQASLPRPAGPELSLNRVSVDGTMLDLGYAIGRVLPPDEVAPFKAYLERTTRSLFCAEEASEIRYLSRNGVVFRMAYSDPSGAVVSEITVTPAFCG